MQLTNGKPGIPMQTTSKARFIMLKRFLLGLAVIVNILSVSILLGHTVFYFADQSAELGYKCLMGIFVLCGLALLVFACVGTGILVEMVINQKKEAEKEKEIERRLKLDKEEAHNTYR